MKTLNSVKVIFKDSKYNYVTSISCNATKESAEAYFFNKFFNMGCYPAENMQKCIAIEFTDNN